jgi:hypothetical protein
MVMSSQNVLRRRAGTTVAVMMCVRGRLLGQGNKKKKKKLYTRDVNEVYRQKQLKTS